MKGRMQRVAAPRKRSHVFTADCEKQENTRRLQENLRPVEGNKRYRDTISDFNVARKASRSFRYLVKFTDICSSVQLMSKYNSSGHQSSRIFSLFLSLRFCRSPRVFTRNSSCFAPESHYRAVASRQTPQPQRLLRQTPIRETKNHVPIAIGARNLLSSSGAPCCLAAGALSLVSGR